jgi:hypothetical protein
MSISGLLILLGVVTGQLDTAVQPQAQVNVTHVHNFIPSQATLARVSQLLAAKHQRK